MTKRQKMNLRQGSRYGFGILALAGLAAAFWYLGPGSPSATGAPTPVPPRPLPVTGLSLEAVDHYRVTRWYTGFVEARRQGDLGFERGGRIQAVQVEEGQRVEPGDTLAILDHDRLQVERRRLSASRSQAVAVLAELEAGPRAEVIAAARAQVDEIRHQLSLAEQQRRRRGELLQGGEVSEEEFDRFATEAKAMEAKWIQARERLQELEAGTRKERIDAQRGRVEALEAEIASIDLEIQRSRIQAPYAGTVVRRFEDEGEVVDAGQPLLRLLESDALEARIGMAPTAAAQLEIGQTLPLDVGKRQVSARVKALLPELDPATRTQIVVLALSADSGAYAGQVVRLGWQDVVKSDGFWVPHSALQRGEKGLWQVFSLVNHGDSETKLRLHAVEVLHTEADRALIRGSLQAGDRIVATGTHRFAQGQTVAELDS
ncbi:MAG: efflux RND transporter periplasmic adaptor subunit [Planctomycetota bacterium]|nr:MAG: efflux RND transporter periplasmic adaptor subunit [Planctomycetota bacterium]